VRKRASPYGDGVSEPVRRVVGRNPSRFRGRDRPVDSVSLGDAYEFLRLAGSDLRLPCEDEWEKAARAGTKTIYWWGDEFEPGPVNCLGGGKQRRGAGGTNEVTGAVANPFGLLDILGNVGEWVGNGWVDCRRHGHRLGGDVWKVDDSSMGIVCGGSWRDPPMLLRCSERMASPVGDRRPFVGFRVARDVLTFINVIDVSGEAR